VLGSNGANFSIDHDYYELTIYEPDRTNLDYNQYLTDMSDSTVHQRLSNRSVGAANIDLKEYFRFPFYGHEVDKVYVTTGGFLSLSSRIHSFIYKIQYIAPLRLKLDPSLSEESEISYKLTENNLTVEWKRMRLPNASSKGQGETTFQTTLYKNGDITFVYIKTHDNISDYSDEHLYDDKLEIGISDGFVQNGSLYMYHAISVPKSRIKDQTVVLLRAKPTCIRQQNCGDCLELLKTSNFDCSWCPKIQRCSDGADRLREHWDAHRCPKLNVTQLNHCPNYVEIIAVNAPTTMSNSISSTIALSILLLLVVIFILSFYVLKRRRSIKGFKTLNEVEVTPNDVRMLETNYIENE